MFFFLPNGYIQHSLAAQLRSCCTRLSAVCWSLHSRSSRSPTSPAPAPVAPVELVELAPGREIEGEEMGKFEENLEGS